MTISIEQVNKYRRLIARVLQEDEKIKSALISEQQGCELCEQRYDFWSPNIEPHQCNEYDPSDADR